MSFQEEDFYYDRKMFFNELSQSIERKKLSTNSLFCNYLNDFKDIVQHNGLILEEMTIICQLLCKVDLSVHNFKKILLTLVPEEPSIPSNVCEELIVWALLNYRKVGNGETKAQYIFYWLLYVVEEKLTDLDTVDKYYKLLFHLCNYGNLSQPIAGIIYNLTKPDDVQKWMVSFCKNNIDVSKNHPFLQKLLTFFENPDLIHETRQKGAFDCRAKFCKELACGLRSVRKELMNIHPHSGHSQQLKEYRRKSSNGPNIKVQFVNINSKFELPSAKDLARSFLKPSISNNSLSHLSNVIGWCKLLMNTDKELNLQHRFSNNLYHSLDQIFLSNESSLTPQKKTKFLQEILEFQKFSQRGLVAVNNFIFEYLLSWDGLEFAQVIYELFEYLSFTSVKELENRFLEKLYAIFITGDELIYRMVINSLTKLLCNLHLNSRQTRTEMHCVLFGNKLRGEKEFEVVKCLTKHISHWCSLCIYHYPLEEQLKHTVYTFFENVSVLENLDPHIWPLWTIMPPNVFFNGLMSVNIYWLDRLAKLMLRHIEKDTSRVELLADTQWICETSIRFDQYMSDFFNALKLGKLFDNREEGFIFNNVTVEEIQKEMDKVNLNTCFELDKHIALAPYYMNAENTITNPLKILEAEAPNAYTLLLALSENIQSNETENESTSTIV